MEFNAKAADGSPISEAVSDIFQCTLTLSVEDAAQLWDSAARIFMLADDDISLDDVVDTIGPREDPNITDCLTTLMTGMVPGGCVVKDICLTGNAVSAERRTSETSLSHETLLDVARPIEVPTHYGHLPSAPSTPPLSLHSPFTRYHAPS